MFWSSAKLSNFSVLKPDSGVQSMRLSVSLTTPCITNRASSRRIQATSCANHTQIYLSRANWSLYPRHRKLCYAQATTAQTFVCSAIHKIDYLSRPLSQLSSPPLLCLDPSTSFFCLVHPPRSLPVSFLRLARSFSLPQLQTETKF